MRNAKALALLTALGWMLAGNARADLVLNSATLQDNERGDVHDATFGGGSYGHPYNVSTSASQSGSTLIDGPTINSYTDTHVAVSSTNSGTTSVLPGPSSFTSLSFSLSSAGSASNTSGTYAASTNDEYYTGLFTPDKTGQYTLSATVTATDTDSGATGTDYNPYVFVYPVSVAGSNLFGLQVQAAGKTGTQTATDSVVVTLQAGVQYGFRADASSQGYFNFGATGSDMGNSTVTFSLTPYGTAPEPSTLLSAGLGAAALVAWRRRRRRSATV